MHTKFSCLCNKCYETETQALNTTYNKIKMLEAEIEKLRLACERKDNVIDELLSYAEENLPGPVPAREEVGKR